MYNILDINKLVFNHSIWLTIIAINMTVIGLTSLAETKKIIGVDYGKFLIKSYKLFGILRIYYLLIIFASINIVSLFSMFVSVGFFRSFNFLALLLSLVFAIFYFFSFILIENPSVKRQIHISQLLGLYYKSDDVSTFDADLYVKMNNGWRSDKRLATNVISYFNIFNSESQHAFKEIFGPRSLLYDESKKNLRLWRKRFGLIPYDYKSKYGLFHISHEFFQLFRYSELQEKWILEILRLFNCDYSEKSQEIRLDNLLRVMAHINQFGKCENLFSYKFFEYLSPYIYDVLSYKKMAINHCEDKIKTKEEFLLNELVIYIFKVLAKKEDETFYRTALSLCNKIILFYSNNNFLNVNKVIIIPFKYLNRYKCEKNKDFVTELFNTYLIQDISDKISVIDIVRLMRETEVNKSKSLVTKMDLFREEIKKS